MFFPSVARRSPALRQGFTLIELLVSIAVIGVLVTMALAGLRIVRKAGQRTASVSDIRTSAAALLMMAGEENGVIKVWKGGTSGTTGAWPVKLRTLGYITDTRVFYATPRPSNVEYPGANWYLYTWGMYLADPRASQSINTAPDGYQIRLTAIDNPSSSMLLGDTILLTSARANDIPARQSFRILRKTGLDESTNTALQTRDGRTVLMAFFDGSVEHVQREKLYNMGVRNISNESGTIQPVSAP